jgi:hypothetical protein
MNTEKIAYLINNPQQISNEDIEIIKALKDANPYSSTAHMLLIKGLANIKSLNFESELKKSAIHVNDREKLHDLVNSKVSNDKSQFIKVEPQEEVIVENKPEVKLEKKLPITTTLNPQEETTLINSTSTPKNTEERKKNADTEKADMAKIIAELQLKVDQARLKNSDSKDNQKHLETELDEELIEKDDTIQKVDLLDNEEEEEEEEVILDETSTVEKIEPLKEEIINEPIKELNVDVLSHAIETAFELDVENIIREPEYDNKRSETILEQNDNDVEEIEVSDINNLSFTEWLKYKQGNLKVSTPLNEPANESISLTKNEINSLLNKFIEEEPKISRPQKEFYNPVKNAKKSLDESTVLVSETLAKIYWMQKNYDKAIKAYEQLSLLNPKKKSFFANQITKIKQENN